jgi:Zn-dependent peptidase ImmA (M78 family)
MILEKDVLEPIYPAIKTTIGRFHDDINSIMENPLFDIEIIAKKLGITDIQRVDPELIIDGKPVLIKHAVLIGTVIFLNKFDNPQKQRFSIAHEIFHFFMRDESDFMRAVARQGETWKIQNAGSPIAFEEEIADYFAANLLIPTEQFILWEDKSNEEIAEVFGVEVRCIELRREEIEHELELMAPKALSSNVKIEEQTPLSLDELDRILEGHSTKRARRSGLI